MPTSNDDLRAELLRARDRLHRLETSVATLELQGKAHGEALERVARQVDGLAKADEIAKAVAERMKASGTLHLTPTQKRAALGAIALIIANIIGRLFGIEGLL